MESQIDLALLGSENPCLAICSPDTRQALAERGTVRSFESEMLLYRERGSAGVVLFLLQGILQMSRTADRGRRQVLCTVDTAACGGICLLMMAERGLGDVQAMSSGQVLVLSRADFQQLARQDPMLCHSAWNAVTECMTHLSNLVESLSFQKVAERVASMLWESTDRDGDLVRRTQSELAAEVGTTREVVARCLAGLQTAGAVRLGRGRITVVNRGRLQAEA